MLSEFLCGTLYATARLFLTGELGPVCLALVYVFVYQSIFTYNKKISYRNVRKQIARQHSWST